MKKDESLKYNIERKIKEVLQIDSIEIITFGENVTLKGIANSYDEKDKIEQIAWDTIGVISVNNELSIYNEK